MYEVLMTSLTFVFLFVSVKTEHYLLTDEYLDAVRQTLLEIWSPPKA